MDEDLLIDWFFGITFLSNIIFKFKHLLNRILNKSVIFLYRSSTIVNDKIIIKMMLNVMIEQGGDYSLIYNYLGCKTFFSFFNTIFLDYQ